MGIRAIALTCAGLAAAFPAAAAPPADCPKQLFEKPVPDAARRELEMVVNVVVGYEGCVPDAPGFAERYRPFYERWRRVYRDPVERYERNDHARRYVQCGLEHERVRMAAESKAGKAQKAELCHTVIGPGIGALVEQAR